MFRQWGLDELLPPAGASTTPTDYDLSYAVPDDLDLHETYEWRIDSARYTLEINGTHLSVSPEAANKPVVVVTTSRDFMRRWVAGETTWDEGRSRGDVEVTGSDDAWDRMLLATGYPGRPKDLAQRIRAHSRPRDRARRDPRHLATSALSSSKRVAGLPQSRRTGEMGE
jgi:hypothetical protein